MVSLVVFLAYLVSVTQAVIHAPRDANEGLVEPFVIEAEPSDGDIVEHYLKTAATQSTQDKRYGNNYYYRLVVVCLE